MSGSQVSVNTSAVFRFYFALSSSISLLIRRAGTFGGKKPLPPAGTEKLFALLRRGMLIFGGLPPGMAQRAPLVVLALIAAFSVATHSRARQQPPQNKKPTALPNAPQSIHFPILLLAAGVNPAWDMHIGQKGPELLERDNYPPIPLDPADVALGEAANSWTYNAKDSQTGASVVVHLAREACVENGSAEKYTFKVIVEHAQIGTLNGCARMATELFPKLGNQQDNGDPDEAKKSPSTPVSLITKFKSPVAFAYRNAAGRVVVARGPVRKVVAPDGTELSLSYDGKRLLYTRSDSKAGPEAAIVLYDGTTGRSRDLVNGVVRQAFWSTDDARLAFLEQQGGNWQIWTCPAGAPEGAAPLYQGSVASLQGWVDLHTLLATDAQNAYWIADDGRVVQTVPLQQIYGDAFRGGSSDTLRINPVNADVVLVSAAYEKPPTEAPLDSSGRANGFFLYEFRSKRRAVLSPTGEWARNADWSRDGVQIFYTRRVSSASYVTNRVFWDGSGVRRYVDGTDLVVGE